MRAARLSTAPATVPRPTVPSQPGAQLPESFPVYVKALQADLKCPACRKKQPPFSSFSGLISHLNDKGNALHIAWRTQNAELLVQLRVEAFKGRKAELQEQKQRQQEQKQRQQEQQQRLQEQRAEAARAAAQAAGAASREAARAAAEAARAAAEAAGAAREQEQEQQQRQQEREQPGPAESAKRKASELALHDEEQVQDVQAAGLADEVAGLRALSGGDAGAAAR